LRTLSSLPPPPPSKVLSVAFSPDGKRVVIGSQDGRVKIYDDPCGDNEKLLYAVAVSLSEESVKDLKAASALHVAALEARANALQSDAAALRYVSTLDETALGQEELEAAWAEEDARWAREEEEEIAQWAREDEEVAQLKAEGDKKTLLAKAAVLAAKAASEERKKADTMEVGGDWIFPRGRSRVLCFGSGLRGGGCWQVCTLKGHTDAVWSVAFSPDGKRVFSGSPNHTLRIWDAGIAAKVCCFVEVRSGW